jgi:hypothetical protein
MPTKNQSCLNCYFFLQTGQSDSGKIGYCRAEPPRAHYATDGDGLVKVKIARFPVVLSEMWCGMWDAQDTAPEGN